MKTRKSLSKDHDDEILQTTEESLSKFVESAERDAITTLESSAKEKLNTQYKPRRKRSKDKNCSQTYDNASAGLEANGKSSSSNNIHDDSNNSDLCTHPKLVKKPGTKKSRNLDLVVSRMLKAKKEIAAPQISCESKEITSSESSINRFARDERVDPGQRPGKENELIINNTGDQKISIGTSGGMIDVQQPAGENHLARTEEDVLSSARGIPRSTHIRSSLRNLATDSCSSPDFSPLTRAASDGEGSALRPFVQSSPRGEENEEGRNKMSPIIKQEPVATADGRLSMYHQNGPGMNSHSPASSYNSHPSPEQRSPSPSSPRDANTERLASPQQLAINSAMHELTSRNATMLMMNGEVNSQLQSIYSRPRSQSPRAAIQDLSFHHDPNGSGVTAAAMAASGIGLPTLVPTISAIPPNGAQRLLHAGLPVHSQSKRFLDAAEAYAASRRNGSDHSGIQVSPHAPAGPNPTRGIVGHKEAAAASEGRGGGRRGGNVDEKCPYKRPPHTYPALIASAILDSPGNLITLRGIYDYIMNNFPYYKFGHDKSAWQNSIRHNLSLNQCFVKVPRYENAAKSNYWTMTREGFEEFGNENSFKRRRRRGAALAPISAYKNKKCNNINDGGRNSKQRNAVRGNSPLPDNKTRPCPTLPERSHTPEPGLKYNTNHDAYDVKALKRAVSPDGELSRALGGKHPRMMVLKQGEGPNLEGISGRADHPQRPNSLSSVEEMQGNLNSFSKTLSAATETSAEAGRSPKRNIDRNSPAEMLKHQWMVAAMQKNLFQPGIIPEISSTSPPLLHQERYLAETRDSSKAGISTPVLLDGIEIGSQTPAYYGHIGSPQWSYICRFCDYKYAGDNSTLLEKHCQLMHQLDLTNAKAKAVAAAAVAGRLKDRDISGKSISGVQDQPGSALSLPNVVSGLSPSMFAAAATYSNAQNFFAAAQAAGLAALPLSAGYSNPLSVPSVTNASSHFVDTLTRAVAQQINSGSVDSRSSPESLRLQQFPAAAASVPNIAENSNLTQEQLRQLIYQQLISQSPFFPGNTPMNAATPRPTTGNGDMTQLAQQFLQYQQKMLEMAAQGAKQTHQECESQQKSSSGARSPNRNRKDSSSSASSRQNERTGDADDSERQEDIHGWKQCQDCDFTAKGSHGLELHYRKVHSTDGAENENKLRIDASAEDRKKVSDAGDGNSFSKKSNTGVSEDGRRRSVEARREFGTQTSCEEDGRTCVYCNITFGDDTMYALHMTCHDKTYPFRCKICDQNCHEKYYFNVHLLQGLHQPNPAKVEKKLSTETADRFDQCRRKSSEETSASSVSETDKGGQDATSLQIENESNEVEEQI